MKLNVIGPRVFVRPDKLPEMTADGSLHLVYDRQAHSTMTGTVVAVGDGPEFVRRASDAAFNAILEAVTPKDDVAGVMIEAVVEKIRARHPIENIVEVGERVVFSPDTGEELIFEKDLLVCLREDDILAVIDKE